MVEYPDKLSVSECSIQHEHHHGPADPNKLKNLHDWHHWNQAECEQVLEVSINESIARFRLA